MSLSIDSLDHLVLNVADVEASAAWYSSVLGMRRGKMTSMYCRDPDGILIEVATYP